MTTAEANQSRGAARGGTAGKAAAGKDTAGKDTAGKPSKASSRTSAFLGGVPHIAGLILALFTAATLLTSLIPPLRRLTHVPREYMDQYYFDMPDTSFAWVVVLALLAAAVAARKRIGWWLLTIYLALYALTNISMIVNDPDDSSAIAALAVHVVLLAVLIAARRQFPTRVRRGSGRRALAVLIGGLALGTMLGWGLVELFPGTLESGQRLGWAANRVIAFSNVDADNFTGHTHSLVNSALGLFGALAVIAAAITLFRSQRAENALTGDDESLIRALLERFSGGDSLGYFATRRDKAVVFAPNGRAAVTYRVEAGVCLASGDPVGDSSAWPDAIEAWLARAGEYGWAPAVMGAGAEGAKAYDKHGLTALELGDEAILETRTFTLAGREMRPVRQAVTRIQRSGAVVRIRRHRDISPEEMAQVIERADAWRGAETERGFSMALGRLGDPADGDCLLVEALLPRAGAADDASPQVLAMLSFVPWGRNGVSLDLMRRDPASANGVVEFMTSGLVDDADQHGIKRISLNFAVFRSVFEEGARIGAGPILRAWRRLLLFFSRWWQLESLYRSNVKYQPTWEPRYLCFADNRLLPRISIASGIAEGFISVPKLGRGGHTGQRSSVPEQVLAAGILHSDGSGPDLPGLDVPERQQGPRRPDQVRVRIAKSERLRAAGIDPYPVAQQPTHSIADARAAAPGTTVRVAGRLLRLRDHGGVVFALLRDWSGDLQLLADLDGLGPERLAEFTSRVDLGDLIEVSGRMGAADSGELSLLVRGWRMNAKCLHPLPDKWRGLTDPEARVRSRYVDLAINPHTREIATARSAVLRSLRDSLHHRGFLEVETPILQQVHGGANARPFTTHINAYDLDLYLRIAPELYLKRLCVGGMERVFELGRTFRNEGVDFSHNPEFTILEAYEAHSDYLRMMDTCRELIQSAAIAANGRCVVLRPGPGPGSGADSGAGSSSDAAELVPVDISGKWPVITVHGAVSRALDADIGPETGLKQLRRLADAADVPWQPGWDAGAVVLELYEHLVEGRTQEPTFYTEFPTSVSPLTRPHRLRAGVAERWDLVAYGVELGTAYSELTDPIDQRERLTTQSLLAADGDPEAMELDEDFLRALEHGMPPTGGLGMGVDRVVMLITGLGIRDTLPFPLAKPR